MQIQNAAQDSLLRLETSGECAENGQVELIQVLLGRGDVYSDGQFELNGDGAGFTADIGYLGQKAADRGHEPCREPLGSEDHERNQCRRYAQGRRAEDLPRDHRL
ncbi:MAG: hypothetical protein ACLRSD_16180 [Oscillibacter sp.]